MSLVSIILTGGGILFIIGLIADWTLPHKTDPQDWDIGPPPNPLALISYLSAFLLFFLGFLGFFCSYLRSTPEPTPKPRKVEMVIPGDAQMNAEIIRKNTRIHLKNL